MLTIDKLAALAGATPSTLRYYEREGMIPPAAKADNGYRLFPQDTARRVHFIRQAQQCGFTLAEIRELLTLSQQASARCSDVRRLVVEKKLALEARIRLITMMSAELVALIANCIDGNQPLEDCAILNAFSRMPVDPGN